MVLAVAAAMLGASVYATTLNDIFQVAERMNVNAKTVSYTHLRAHETN